MNMFTTSVIREIRTGLAVKPNFLRELFFKNVELLDDETIILEYKKGGNVAAPFVSPIENGKVQKNKGRTANIIVAPNIQPKHVINAKDIFVRMVGASFQGGLKPAQKQATKILEILAEQETQITNKEELMISNFLLDGKVKSLKGEYPVEVDYQMTNQWTLAGTEKWTDPLADIFASIRKYVGIAEAKSKELVDKVVVGEKAANLILSSDKVDKKLDILNKTEAVIQTIKQFPGIMYLGKLDSKIEIYSFNQSVVDATSGDIIQLLPPNAMIGGPSNGTILYAPIVDFKEKTIYVTDRYSRDNVSENGKELSITTEGRPVLQPRDVDGYFSVIVCDED